MAYISWRRRGERLVHATLDGEFDVVSVHRGLLGVCGVDFGILNDSRHISCERKQPSYLMFCSYTQIIRFYFMIGEKYVTLYGQLHTTWRCL